MADFAKSLGASKSASTLLVLFIPGRDRAHEPIDQGYWVDETLNTLGALFGGATAYPRACPFCSGKSRQLVSSKL
jgi:hypothetical protein